MSAINDNHELTVDLDLDEDERVFNDAARVLSVRRQMDELSLSMLTEPGLRGASVGQLLELLDSPEYGEACVAWDRLEGLL